MLGYDLTFLTYKLPNFGGLSEKFPQISRYEWEKWENWDIYKW